MICLKKLSKTHLWHFLKTIYKLFVRLIILTFVMLSMTNQIMRVTNKKVKEFNVVMLLLQLQVASKEHLSKLCNKLGFESLKFGSWFKKTTYVPFINLTKLVTYLMLILNPITYQHTWVILKAAFGRDIWGSFFTIKIYKGQLI